MAFTQSICAGVFFDGNHLPMNKIVSMMLGCRHATKVNFEQLQNLTMINFLDAEGLKLFLQLVRDGLGVAASDDRAIRYVVKSRTMQAI